MTCIIGIEVPETGRVLLGADTLMSTTRMKSTVTDSKLFYFGDTLIGFAGSIRQKQILKYMDQSMGIASPFPIEYLIKNIVEPYRIALETANAVTLNNGTADHESEFLIGYKGKVYHVATDFSVTRSVRGYEVIGAGEYFAHGALEAFKNEKSAEDRLMEALRIAALFSPWVAEPFETMRI